MGQILGAVSLFALIVHAFHLGIGSAMGLLLEYFERVLQLMLGWAEPYIQSVLDWVNSILGWHLILAPHWKNIAFLMSLYFGAYVWDAMHRRFFRAMFFYIVVGFPIAIICAVATGSVSLEQSGIWKVIANVTVASIPLIGVIVFSLVTAIRAAKWYRPEGVTFDQQLRRLFRHPIRFAVIGWSIVLVGCVSLSFTSDQKQIQPSVIVLLVLTLALAIYRIILQDAWQGQEPGTRSTVEWWRDVNASGGGRIGLRMLRAFFGAVALVLLNVGQQLLGL